MHFNYIKIIITVMSFIMALSVSAQDFKVGVEGGIGLSTMKYHIAQPSINMGVVGDYHFNDDWMLDASLKLCSRNKKMDTSPASELKSDPYYLELPIHIAKKFYPSENINIYVGVGPMIGYGLFGNTKETMIGNVNGETVTKVRTEKYFDSQLRLEHGFSVKAGVDIKKHYRVSLGYNLMNHGGSSSNNSHNLSLNLGYIF